MVKRMKQNKIVIDSAINIFATAVLTLTTQLIVYPFLSRNLNAEMYGDFLTVIGIINTIAVSIGNTLNIKRLLVQPVFEKENIVGDTNLIFIKMLVSLSLILSTCFLFIFNYDILTTLLLVVLGVFISFRAFYVVSFRIKLDYYKLLWTNIFSALGYLVGIIVFPIINSWIIVFLLGELFSVLYILFYSEILREPLIKTKYYKNTFNDYITLLSSSMVGNGSLYLDRFLLNPILGSGQVSIYTVASFLGKSVNLVVSPINSVILSHYAKENGITRTKLYKRLSLYALLYGIIYLGILIIGYPIISILYPTIAPMAKPYFWIANLSTLIMGYGGTVMQMLLKFSYPKWQLVVNISYIIIYVILAILGMSLGGLMGFSISILISNTLRVLLMIYILLKSTT